MRVCDWGRFTCTSVLHSLKRNRMFIRLIGFIRRDSNSSALPVKEVRAVQRSNNNNIKNAFRLVLPHKLITKSVWYCLTSTCPHFLLRNKGGFLQCSFPVWAIKTKPFLSLPRSVIMADEYNVTWKRNFTESNLVILVNIDSWLRLPSPLFGGRDFIWTLE